MKKIALILTTYNAETTIERLIESLQSQQGLNSAFTYQWLVVDDCSTDGTQQKLEQLGIPFQVNEKNSGGPNAGRNKALRQLNAEYATIVDDDDVWLPNKMMQSLNYVKQAPIVSSHFTILNKDKRSYKGNFKQEEFKRYAENETFLQLLQRDRTGQTTYLGSLFFSTAIPIPQFEMQTGKTDFSWKLELFHNQPSVEVCEPLYIRHVDGQNLSLNENYRLQEFEMAQQIIEGYAKEYPKEVKKGLQNNAATLAKYYYVSKQMPKARKYFQQSKFTAKNALYWLTSYYGYNWVIKNFPVFG